VQFVGGVPYVDLGLDRSVALDGWENYITYVMSPNWQFAYDPGALTATTTNVVPTAAFNAAAAFYPLATTGAIAVYGAPMPTLVMNACNTVQGAVPANTGAAVVLVSHGSNGFYAVNVKNGQNQPPVATADELQNSPNGGGGLLPICPPWDQFRLVRREGPIGNVDTFDDLVMTIGRDEFTTPLIASGAVQGGPDWAFSKAKDIVLGNIGAGRMACPGPVGPLDTCVGFYYNIPAAGTIRPLTLVYGVDYAQFVAGINLTIPGAGTPVFQLQAPGDVSARQVSVDEIRAVILRSGAGFN
jgi:hypothetical protein